jgi:hypothetical protein
MTAIDTEAILQNGAVLTKGSGVVNLELEDDLGLFFMSQVGGVLDTDRAQFDSRQERDEALLNTVRGFLGEGWTLTGEEDQ